MADTDQPKETPHQQQASAYKLPEDAVEKAEKEAEAKTPKETKAARRREKIQAQRMGFDPLRPLRYGAAFVGGTVNGALDGIAGGGRKGLWIGAGIGLLASIAGFGIPMIVLYGVYGFAGGALLGGAVGTLTGGVKGVGRSYHKEKYADELAVKHVARPMRIFRGNHAEAYESVRHAQNYNFDRMIQQENTARRDEHRYWQDHVGGEGHGHGWHRGGL
jgi:hypothetical protein